MSRERLVSVQKASEDDLGILIGELEPLLLKRIDFLRIACLPQALLLPRAWVKQRASTESHMTARETRAGHMLSLYTQKLKAVGFPDDGVPAMYGWRWGSPSRHRKLHLFALDSSLLISETMIGLLEFPVELAGYIWIVDADELLREERDSPRAFGVSRRSGIQAINWMQTQGRPFLITATGSDSPEATAATVRRILDPSEQAPMVVCPSRLDSEHVTHVLSTLLERMVAEGLPK